MQALEIVNHLRKELEKLKLIKQPTVFLHPSMEAQESGRMREAVSKMGGTLASEEGRPNFLMEAVCECVRIDIDGWCKFNGYDSGAGWQVEGAVSKIGSALLLERQLETLDGIAEGCGMMEGREHNGEVRLGEGSCCSDYL